MELAVAFPVVLVAALRVALTNQCSHRTYFMWPGVNRDGVIAQAVPGSVPLSACQRACLLYNDCVGFNFNWTDVDRQSGLCTILSDKFNWTNAPQFDEELAFYGK